MHDGMTHDFTHEEAVLFLGRQGAVDKKVRGFKVRGLQRKLLDWVSSTPPLVPDRGCLDIASLTYSGGL